MALLPEGLTNFARTRAGIVDFDIGVTVDFGIAVTVGVELLGVGVPVADAVAALPSVAVFLRSTGRAFFSFTLPRTFLGLVLLSLIFE